MMMEQNINTVSRDVKTLIGDAQDLLHAAASLTGDKAEEMQRQGVQMMEAAVAQAKQTHAAALANGKKMVRSADHYVKDHPWRAVAAVAGVGLLVGVILSRR